MSFAANSECPRQIALVDCNNFYVSCERVFNPAWAHRPLGVLSNNDGCLVSRSEELKAAGIPMGVPYFKQRERLKAMGAVVVSSNYALYGDMSARVMATLSQFVPEMEVYSIDEAWLDLSGMPSVDGYARTIAATTYQHTGIPVSIGIGATKVLAKVANRICKQLNPPGRVFHLGNDPQRLASVPVEDLWGVGKRWAKRLRAEGIQTALDLRDVDERRVKSRYGVVLQRLILELRGIPCLAFEEIKPKKQIICSRSFGRRVLDLDPLLQAIAAHATRAGEKLRSQALVCGVLQCTIRSGRFNPQEVFFNESALIHFASPTADTRRLIRAACEGVRRIYQPGPRYAKARVMLLDLSPADAQQQNLLTQTDDEQSGRLMQMVDELNRRYGRRTLFFASEAGPPTWKMNQNYRTPAFTTRWDELPMVR